MDSPEWMRRFDWMDTLGSRWWPIFGAAYFLVATKRVRGIRWMGKVRGSPAKRKVAAVPVARQGRVALGDSPADQRQTCTEESK
jgi:hypothetical protein